MAGEFPDRSKQRESSEEPTSGSAGPVPGARGESGAGARDPRLAVARDRESTARGGVDTATRVFSRPPLPADEGDADVSTPDTAPEAESEPEDAVPAGGGTDGTGSTRLRAAVAAWVAGADEGEGKDGSEGAEGAAEKAASMRTPTRTRIRTPRPTPLRATRSPRRALPPTPDPPSPPRPLTRPLGAPTGHPGIPARTPLSRRAHRRANRRPGPNRSPGPKPMRSARTRRSRSRLRRPRVWPPT